jgi:hypothetical protein
MTRILAIKTAGSRNPLDVASDRAVEPACGGARGSCYRKRPAIRKTLTDRQNRQPAEAIAIAWTAQRRLRRTWTWLEARSKRRGIRDVAMSTPYQARRSIS